MWIIDLGIAALLEDGAGGAGAVETLTVEGAVLGTPWFMSPEQARGERGEEGVSTRSDVYSLGATGYAVLTGRTPHGVGEGEAGTSLYEAIRRVAEEEALDPRELDPTMPKGLAAVLMKACARQAQGRYGSAGEFAAGLRRWLRGEAVMAAGLSRWGRGVRWVGRHPAYASAALSVLILAGSLAGTKGAVWWYNRRPAVVVVDPYERSWVRVLAASGKMLYEWPDAGKDGVLFAELVDRPDGTGKYVVIGWGAEAANNDRGLVAAYDPESPGVSVWRKGVPGVDLFRPEPAPDPEDDQSYRLYVAELHDVFADEHHPGPEIVAVHKHSPMSSCAVRIYDAEGEVLYEAWHDGHVSDVHWLPRAEGGKGLLVASGVNSDGESAEILKVDPEVVWPEVIFALRVEEGRHGFIETDQWAGTHRPVWYRFLRPHGACAALGPHRRSITAPPSQYSPDWFFGWNLVPIRGGEREDVTLILNGKGEAVGGFNGDRCKATGLTWEALEVGERAPRPGETEPRP